MNLYLYNKLFRYGVVIYKSELGIHRTHKALGVLGYNLNQSLAGGLM